MKNIFGFPASEGHASALNGSHSLSGLDALSLEGVHANQVNPKLYYFQQWLYLA